MAPVKAAAFEILTAVPALVRASTCMMQRNASLVTGREMCVERHAVNVRVQACSRKLRRSIVESAVALGGSNRNATAVMAVGRSSSRARSAGEQAVSTTAVDTSKLPESSRKLESASANVHFKLHLVF